jgi:adenylate kinase family enzyme
MTAARLLIIGPQGSGKGTQGVRIAEALGIPAVSTGDVFRANVKEGTELGLKVKAIIDAGDLVPDTLTGAIVRDRLAQDDAAPASCSTATRATSARSATSTRSSTSGEPLTAVIELVVPRDESIRACRCGRPSRAVPTTTPSRSRSVWRSTSRDRADPRRLPRAGHRRSDRRRRVAGRGLRADQAALAARGIAS